MEAYFYALIAICGILVALRAVVYAIRLCLSEPSRTPPRTDRNPKNWNEAVPVPAETTSALGREPEGSASLIWLRTAVSGVQHRLLSLTRSREHGFAGKLVVVFTAIASLFGVVTIATVYLVLSSFVERYADERATLTARTIADNLPALTRTNLPKLRSLALRRAGQRGNAYVLIENTVGEVLAHSFAVLPEELNQGSKGKFPPAENLRILRLEQRTVREVTVPILQGRGGLVRVGIWQDDSQAEVFRTLNSLMNVLMLVICCSIGLMVYFAWRISRPIVRLVRAARSISTGEIEIPPLDVDDPNECGELSRSLERLRSSVKAAMTRLNART